MVYKHKDLVDACVLNDRNAQMEIYDLYYKAMYNTSIRIVNDSFLAEDIMQESFLDAFSKLKTFEWRSSFGSWLKRIVVNKSLDYIRKNSVQMQTIDDVTEISVGDNYDNYDDYEQIECRLEEVRSTLNLLSRNYKVILVLHLFEGYDHKEISHILNLPYNNVRVRYIRAKRKLLEEIVKSRGQHVLN